MKGDTLNHVKENSTNKNLKETSIQNPVINEEFSLSDDSKDESKVELTEDSKPSSSDSSKEPLNTSVPALPIKSNKKREKFDSGVGDEIENSKDSDSDNVLDIEDLEEEEDNSMDIDSDSDYSEHHAPHRRKVTRLFDPYDPDCPCGGDCRDDGEDDCTLKKKNTDKKSDTSSVDTEASEKSKGPSIESYSIYMREKIKLLPIPLALKMYLNYNREL